MHSKLEKRLKSEVGIVADRIANIISSVRMAKHMRSVYSLRYQGNIGRKIEIYDRSHAVGKTLEIYISLKNGESTSIEVTAFLGAECQGIDVTILRLLSENLLRTGYQRITEYDKSFYRKEIQVN